MSHSLLLWMFLSVFGYIGTDSTCIRTSLDLCMALCLSVSVSEYIIGNCQYVSKRVQLTHRVIALSIFFDFFSRVYVRLDFYYFISLSLFLSLSLNVYLYYDSSVVCACTSLHPVSYSLSLWISVLLFGNIVTHCTCICTSLDPYLSLFSL